jgi:glycosyltransferase involved in cell wall biosynthesis
LRYFGSDAAAEFVRSLRVRAMPLMPSVRHAARNSSLALATNEETSVALRRAGARLVIPFLDSGINPEMLDAPAEPWPAPDRLTLLWAGCFEPRKALPLALQALAARPDIPARLIVAGDGPLRRRWERMTVQLGLAGRVEFLGWVPWKQMSDLYRRADAFLFTSLRDSFAAVNLEAMANRLPIIALDHQGAAAFVPHDAGLRASVESPESCIRDLGKAIETVYRHPEKRIAWGNAGLAFARTQTWTLRAGQMHEWYERLAGRANERPAAQANFAAPTHSAERA